VRRPFDPEAPDEATIADYLANRLDSSNAEAFEDYCLRHPEFARQVETDLYLKVGLKQIQEPSPVAHRSPRRRLALGIAAIVAVLAAGVILLLPRLQGEAVIAYRSATDVPAALLAGPRVRITLIRLRDGSPVHRVQAPPDAGTLLVRLAPDAPPGRLGYIAVVAYDRAGLSHSVTLDRLTADADGYVQLYLPTASLLDRTVRISVNPAPLSGTPAPAFQLQIAPAPSTPVLPP
jgi:hypothetical protein